MGLKDSNGVVLERCKSVDGTNIEIKIQLEIVDDETIAVTKKSSLYPDQDQDAEYSKISGGMLARISAATKKVDEEALYLVDYSSLCQV